MNDDDATRHFDAWGDHVPDRRPRMAELIATAKAVERRRTRVTIGLVGASVALTLGGGAVVQQVLADADRTRGPASTDAPQAPEGRRLLGTGRVAVAVPDAWVTDKPTCADPPLGYVSFKALFGHTLCPVPDDPQGAVLPYEYQLGVTRISAVEVRDTLHDLKGFVPDGEVDGREVLSDTVTCPPEDQAAPGWCRQMWAVPAEDVLFSLHWPATENAGATAASIRESLQVLPDGYTTVPYVEPGTSYGDVQNTLVAAGLNPEIVNPDPMPSGWGPVDSIAPEPGSVAELGSTVSVTIGGTRESPTLAPPLGEVRAPSDVGASQLTGRWELDRMLLFDVHARPAGLASPYQDIDPEALAVTFEEGTWHAQGGCDFTHGGFTLVAGRFAHRDPVGTNSSSCPEGIESRGQVSNVANLMLRTGGVRVEGDFLYLLSGGKLGARIAPMGTVVAVLTRVPTSTAPAGRGCADGPLTGVPERVLVFFACEGETSEVGTVYAFERAAPSASLEARLDAAVTAYFEGPTSAEGDQFYAFGPPGTLNAVAVRGDRAIIDVNLDGGLGSTAAQSALVWASLRALAFQFPAISTMEPRYNNSCASFGAAVEAGRCLIAKRDGSFAKGPQDATSCLSECPAGQGLPPGADGAAPSVSGGRS